MSSPHRTFWCLWRDTLCGPEALFRLPTVGFRAPQRDEPLTANLWSFESEGRARMLRKHLKVPAQIERRSKVTRLLKESRP